MPLLQEPAGNGAFIVAGRPRDDTPPPQPVGLTLLAQRSPSADERVRLRGVSEHDGGVEVEAVDLPGIGVRHSFETRHGRQIGVVTHRSGRRELLVYDPIDPDVCSEVLPLTDDEADALAELLGAPRIVERLAAIREQVAGLVTEQISIPPTSPYADQTLGDTQARTRTGASIVAVMRRSEVIPSPTPGFRFQPGDVVVVVGTREGVQGVAELLEG